MEELKILIEAVAGLPTITLWVLVGYLIYKLTVIGSIYGIIRFGIEKFVEWRLAPKKFKIGVECISEEIESKLQIQLSRLAAYEYIHSTGVDRLSKAIDIVLNEK